MNSVKKISKSRTLFLSSFIILAILGSFYIYITWSTAINETSSQAMDIAMAAESTLNLEAFKKLDADKGDVGTPAYESIKKNMMKLVDVKDGVRFSYILIKRDEKVYFAVDSEPVDSKDYSPPGQEYDEITYDDKKVFDDGKSVITKAEADRWGTWISALIPIKDYDGRTIGVFGMDYPAKMWDDNAYYSAIQSCAVVFALFMLLLAFNTIIMKNIKIKNEKKIIGMLLNNSGEGFLTFGRDFIIEKECSIECGLIFGMPISGLRVDELIFNYDIETLELFTRSVGIIFSTEDSYRQEVILSLLPDMIDVGSKKIGVRYKILADEKILLILNDITREIELEREMENEQEKFKFIVGAFVNKAEISDLIDDYTDFVQKYMKRIIENDQSVENKTDEILRSIHTYKGLFSQYGFMSLPEFLDSVETDILEITESPLDKSIQTIQLKSLFIKSKNDFLYHLTSDIKIVTDVLGDLFFNENHRVYLDYEKMKKLELATDLLMSNDDLMSHDDVRQAVHDISQIHFENIKDIMGNYPAYSIDLARRLGKSIGVFSIEGDDVLIDSFKYSSFLKSLVHVFRNAIDHGLEFPDERLDSGKDEVGKVSCNVEDVQGKIRLTIKDDGRGVNRKKLLEKALENGILTIKESQSLRDSHVLKLMFESHMTTCDTVNDISGKGYGLNVVIKELEKINGTVDVNTVDGMGTTFIFEF